jgi:hypothetical protein
MAVLWERDDQMTDSMELIGTLDRRAQRRDERREFFRAALGMGALAAGGVATLGFSKKADAQTATITDSDILNFALNLEYLEAQFYSYAFSGEGLAAGLLTGTGTQGGVDFTAGAAGQPRAVDFSGEPLIRQYAREIAADEVAHVAFLREALKTAAVAQPRINISGGANGAFTAAARAANIATTTGTLAGTPSATGTFDPYSSPDAFLLGSYIFEDVGVTAYKGGSPLITSKDFLDAAAGILAAEAFHAGIIRGALYSRGVNTAALRTAADAISDARDSLDGSSDIDQGISPRQTPLTSSNGTTTAAASNFVPTDADGVTYSRTPAQVLNIVYLNRAAATMGGFFPAGVNGTIRAGVTA